ncbi:NADH dehydrogenase 1 beta subcomplex subunit 6 [Nephila pilipes]|uniref:NADH dehydrogenase 1 beta subcomplex subunit 6 n=1 Tax=Nephila pilipes TaxID=299642 RepID=A0A8X6TAV7_NEPPI|nr:NADH dehydrogenase 1 beta subcomplex subunit 6 [Nephila pilipes]
MTDKISKYNYPSSYTGGVKPMSIRGIFEDERIRLSEEFTDEERAWRKQWIKDQVLSPNEPRPESEEWIREVRNPIRRFLSKPWQLLESGLTPVVGKSVATHLRYMMPKSLVIIGAIYFTWYHLKYNQNDWTRAYGVTVFTPKPRAFPGDSNFPVKGDRTEPSDYHDRGFKSRNVFLD